MHGCRGKRCRGQVLALGIALAIAGSRPAFAETPEEPSERQPDDAEPQEVVVRGERPEHEKHLTRKEIRRLPGAFGDPLRAIEMLPGMSPIGSGLPYFYLRGAPPGNIGYFLDGVRVPGLFHFAAGPSALHPGLIESVTLHPGPYPARFGRYDAGVVSVELAPPPAELAGEASLRLVDAGALVTSPFDDHRGYAAVAGRYSYTATVVSLIVPELDLSYWDYQALASYDLTPKDTLGLLSFGASDYVSQERNGRPTTLFDAEFHRIDLRYDRALGGRAKLRVAGTLGADRSVVQEGQMAMRSRSAAVRGELVVPLAENTTLRAGTDVVFERYSLTLTRNTDADVVLVGAPLDPTATLLSPRDDVTTGAWLELEAPVARNVKIRPGLRVDLFASGDTARVGVDPRLFADFDVNDGLTITHGIGVAHQRPGYAIPLPGAQPVLDELQTSVQVSSGVRLALPEDVTASLTGYEALHLNLSDPIADAQDGGIVTYPTPNRWLGRSYGLEFMLQRSLAKRLGGFLTYTLARSERSLGRRRSPSPFDRTHVVGAAVAYDLGRRWVAGVRAGFYTGIPMNVAYVEAARVPPRTPAFWRLDWRVEKSWPLGERGLLSLVLEVLNTTLNREAYRGSCSAYVCKDDSFGPITVPSLGLEAKF